jgi:hypothetical protein
VPDDYRNADAVFWTAPLATETSFGEIAEIGYFVRWIEPDKDSLRKGITAPRPALCRFFVNPSTEDTKAAPTSTQPLERKPMLKNPDFMIYATNPAAWLSPTLIDRLAPAKAPTYAGLFGENVVGLWVKAYGLDGKILKRSFYSLPTSPADTNVGYVWNRPYVDLTGKQQTKPERAYLPARVQISIAQVDSHTVQRLDPVAQEIRKLTRESTVVDAGEFMDRVRKLAGQNRAVGALLPGLRTYTTEVQLENAR